MNPLEYPKGRQITVWELNQDGKVTMNSLDMQLSELAQMLKKVATFTRHCAHRDEGKSAEIHWIAHQVEELADELGTISGIPHNVVAIRSKQRIAG